MNKALFHSLASNVPSTASASKADAKRQPETPVVEHRSGRDPQELKWETALEKWRAGETLPQTEANQLRKWIADALKAFLNWDWDLHHPLKDFLTNDFFVDIYIPRAQGNKGRTGTDESIMLSVGFDTDLLTQAGVRASNLR